MPEGQSSDKEPQVPLSVARAHGEAVCPQTVKDPGISGSAGASADGWKLEAAYVRCGRGKKLRSC